MVRIRRSVTEPRNRRFRPARPWVAETARSIFFFLHEPGDGVRYRSGGDDRFPFDGLALHQGGQFFIGVLDHAVLVINLVYIGGSMD